MLGDRLAAESGTQVRNYRKHDKSCPFRDIPWQYRAPLSHLTYRADIQQTSNGEKMGMTESKRTHAAVAVACMLVALPQARAQESILSQTGKDVTLSPVVVTGRPAQETATGPVEGFAAGRSATATKTDTPLIETPQSISVIGQPQMRAQAADTVGAALRYTPGMQGESAGGLDSTLDYFMVRGFVESHPFLDGLNTLTYFSVMAPKIDTYGLERVEVLRGPASVLYGQSYPGGLVNLVSKRPTREMVNEVAAEVGNYGSGAARFDLGGDLSQDGSLLYRLTGAATSSGSQVDFVQDRRIFIAPALTWQPTAVTRFTLLSSYSYRDSNFPTVDLPAVGTLQFNPNGQIPTSFYDRDSNFDRYRREDASVGWNFDHAFSDRLKVRQNLRYSRAKLDEDVLGNAGLEADLRTMDRYAYRAHASMDSLAADQQVEASFTTGEMRHKVLVGLDFLRSIDRWAEQDAASAPSIDVFNPVYGVSIALPDVDFSERHQIGQTGLYAQDQFRYGGWTAVVGGRQDWSTAKVTDRLANTTQSHDADKFTWRTGITYQFANGVAPYASYSTSFQPAIGESFDGSTLKPTTGKSMEAGVKYQPPGSNSLLMASVYDIRQQNVVEPDFAHPAGNYSVQTGERKVQGVELSATADLGRKLSLVGSYTYMDGVITQSDTGTQGNQANNVPHHMANLWLDKTLLEGPLAGLSVGAGVRYIGERYGDDDNLFRLPSVTLVDAAVRYRIDQHWLVSLNAHNLFDRVYVNCASDNYCSYGLRRTVSARATYQW